MHSGRLEEPMKIRVSKVKEDKGELRGLLLSFLLLLAAVAAFGPVLWFFKQNW